MSNGYQDRRKDVGNKTGGGGYDSRDRSRSNIRPFESRFQNGSSNNRDYQSNSSSSNRNRDEGGYKTQASTKYSRFDSNTSSSKTESGGNYQSSGGGYKPKSYGGYENGGSTNGGSYNPSSQSNGSSAYSSAASSQPAFGSFPLAQKLFPFPPPPLPVKN